MITTNIAWACQRNHDIVNFYKIDDYQDLKMVEIRDNSQFKNLDDPDI